MSINKSSSTTSSTAFDQLRNGVGLYIFCIILPNLCSFSIHLLQKLFYYYDYYYMNHYYLHRLQYNNSITTDVQSIGLLSVCFSILRMFLVKRYVGLYDFLQYPNNNNNSSNQSKDTEIEFREKQENEVSISLSPSRKARRNEENWNAFMRTKSTGLLSSLVMSSSSFDSQDNYDESIDDVGLSITPPSPAMLVETYSAQTSLPPQQNELSRKTTAVAVQTTEENTRQATAKFRFIYSCVVSFYAMLAFEKSSFWSLSLWMDQRNTQSAALTWSLSSSHGNGGILTFLIPVTANSISSLLAKEHFLIKFFYLLQIAYHAQSICFEIWLICLAFLADLNRSIKMRRKTDQSKQFKLQLFKVASLGTGYHKSLIFHVYAAVHIMVTYIFSSTKKIAILVIFCVNLSNVGIYLYLIQKKRRAKLYYFYGATIPIWSYSFLRLLWIWYWTMIGSDRERAQWLHEFQHGIGMGSLYASKVLYGCLHFSFFIVVLWFVMAGKKLLLVRPKIKKDLS